MTSDNESMQWGIDADAHVDETEATCDCLCHEERVCRPSTTYLRAVNTEAPEKESYF